MAEQSLFFMIHTEFPKELSIEEAKKLNIVVEGGWEMILMKR